MNARTHNVKLFSFALGFDVLYEYIRGRAMYYTRDVRAVRADRHEARRARRAQRSRVVGGETLSRTTRNETKRQVVGRMIECVAIAT